MNRPTIHIIGGGVSGLALGIRLQQLGMDSQISEAGTYPRHRVCGEFISGKGIQTLHELELYETFQAAGSVLAQSIKCFSTRSESPELNLAEPALCLSRYSMDAAMARHYESLGGQLTTKQRCPMPRNKGSMNTVYATGRHPMLKRDSALMGYKWHVENLTLEADLEMHFTAQGYVGLCRIEHDKVNICGLTKVPDRQLNIKKEWRRLVERHLHPRRRDAIMTSKIVPNSLCFTSGLSYPITTPDIADGAVQIGDLGACIPPLTGNGMSMAMESSLISAEILKDYHQGNATWRETQARIKRRSRQRFRIRQHCANPVHAILMSKRFPELREWLVKHLDLYHRLLFHLTR